MRHLKLTLSYDGTNYVGWQTQKNGIAIQQRLEEAWAAVTQETIRITASGRTDAGVHAIAQVCSLKTQTNIPNDRLVLAINSNIARDISVLKVEDAATGFHAIRDAVAKTYCYQLQFGRKCDVLKRRFCWFTPGNLDVEAMQSAAAHIIGTHDFSSFEAVGAERPTSIRTVTKLDVTHEPSEYFDYLNISIRADGFLYNMVRNIVGTLVRVGQGGKSPDWIPWLIEQQDRKLAGQTAPPHGLFLRDVEYESTDSA